MGNPRNVSVPKSYKEVFQTMVFGYMKIQPPDDLTREIAYRMVKQKMFPIAVHEENGRVYVVAYQVSRNQVVVFEITPPRTEDPESRFRGWKYRTVRNPSEMPMGALKSAYLKLLACTN